MALISRDLIDEIKKKTDLLKLVSEFTEVIPAGNNLWMAHCPHPDHEDSTPSFRICRNSNGDWSWYCGGCHMGPKDVKHHNYGSDCFAFVSWMSDYKGSPHKIGWKEALEYLAERAGISLNTNEDNRNYKLKYLIAKKKNKELLKDSEAIKYLHDRGLTDKSIKEWLIGVSEKEEFGAKVKRISFPLLSKYNRAVGESNRAIHWDKTALYPKYRNSANSKSFHKGSYLYGLHRYDSSLKELYITEGQIDVILSSQVGMRNVVATLGTSFTKEHAMILKNMDVIPCFCMDGDEAGKKAVRRAVNILSEAEIFTKVFILPEGKDLADMALELKGELEDYIREHCMMYWEFLLQEPLAIFSAQLTQLRSKVLPEIKEAAKGITTDEDDLLMKSFVKERFGIYL